ncbi:hypothetical protein [Zooshikella harenae]|uniref:Flagellar protein n=1 Tax=Zooshikella harenae TaxID=2827238 RepID=A0ABS5ZC84_9GAMM|nr:hypothetical protein [Zooshikella harenae]MBU2711669.1 hypothetical protein [Zooshikella harenae]
MKKLHIIIFIYFLSVAFSSCADNKKINSDDLIFKNESVIPNYKFTSYSLTIGIILVLTCIAVYFKTNLSLKKNNQNNFDFKIISQKKLDPKNTVTIIKIENQHFVISHNNNYSQIVPLASPQSTSDNIS